MIKVLLDEWLFDIGGDDAERLSALRSIFLELLKEYPDLHPVPFLDENEAAALWMKIGRRPGLGAIGPWIRSMTLDHALAVREAEVLDDPKPELSLSWRRAAAEAIGADDSASWRDPLILIPVARRLLWSDMMEIRLKVEETVVSRLLVVAERWRDHDVALRDLDPWFSEFSSSQVGIDIVRRVLPRPPEMARRPMDEWMRASFRDNGVTEDGKKMFFVPRAGWDPADLDKLEWRAGPFAVAKLNRRSGPRDRTGRVWSWDRMHRDHWDVQLQNGKHKNVNTPSGIIRAD